MAGRKLNAVQATNKSGGAFGSIMGAALGAYGNAQASQSRLAEFHAKEGIKTEGHMQRTAANVAAHNMKIKTNTDAATSMIQRHAKGRPNFAVNPSTGQTSWSEPSDYAERMQKVAETRLEEQKLRKENKDAKAADAASGNKKERSTKKSEDAATASDDWAAKPVRTPGSNVNKPIKPKKSPENPVTPKPTKPRAKGAAVKPVVAPKPGKASL